MVWRKCLVRGLVFSVVAFIGGAAWLYQHFTDPEAVRQAVIARLEAQFVDAHVRLESAQLRLLGGISFHELRIVRDGDGGEVLYVPSGIIYHDKETLLDGKLAIRKIECDHPRFRVFRNSEGRWNVAGLLAPPDLSQFLPTIVIHQGTISVEDRQGAPTLSPVELTGLQLTVINDPLLTLHFEGRSSSDLLGAVLIHAAYQRSTEDLTLTVDLPDIPLGAPLAARLATYKAELGQHLQNLEGHGDVHVELTHHPSAEPEWTHDVRCQLRQVKLTHPRIPVPLENLEAELRCTDGRVRIDKLTARSGPAQIEFNVALHSPSLDTDLEGDLKVHHLAITPELFDRLPPNLQDIKDDFQPSGPIDLSVHFSRHDGRFKRTQRLVLDGVSAEFCKFPYRVEEIHGTIEQTTDEAAGENRRHVDIVGLGSAGRPLHIKGDITGDGEKPKVTVDLWGENIPLDTKLREALPAKHQKIADSFHPSGVADFVAHIRREQGAQEYTNDFSVHFHDAAVRYDVFPYPFEHVAGTLDIEPSYWTFHDFRGTHNGCEFRTHGRSDETPTGDHLTIHIEGDNLALDQELVASLPPKLREPWKVLVPGGRMSLVAEVEKTPDMDDEVEVGVTFRGCTLEPRFFPYLLADACGKVRYARGRVDLTKLSAQHGASTFRLGAGQVLLKPGGGFWAKMTDLEVNPLVADPAFLQALPPSIREPAESVKLDGPVALRTELVVDSPPDPSLPQVIYWDGGMALNDARAHAGVDLDHIKGQLWCRGRHNGHQLEGVLGNVLLDEATVFKQPIRGIHTHVEVKPEAPDVLRLPDFQGRLFGGDLGGEVRVEFGPTLHYEINLTALQVQLEEFSRQNLGPNAQMSGQAAARLYLRGQGTDLQGLEGGGSIDVPAGRMYNLPFLLDLLKVLGLRPPDRTAFEEAHAVFNVHGPRVTVSRLDLDGNAISLGGQGEVDLDGSNLQLDFYAVWGRIKQVLPPLFRELPPAISQQLLKIKVRGRLDKPEFTKEPVPMLVEPLQRALRKRSDAPADTTAGANRAPG